MASSGELKGASRIAHTSCAIATQAVTALSAPVQHRIIKVSRHPMFLMNEWFELPYAQEARTWHIPKLWQPSLRGIFLGPDTMLQGDLLPRIPACHPSLVREKRTVKLFSNKSVASLANVLSRCH